MKAPVGLLSDRTVLRSKMEGLCPDKFQFVALKVKLCAAPDSRNPQKYGLDSSVGFMLY